MKNLLVHNLFNIEGGRSTAQCTDFDGFLAKRNWI